MVIDVPGSEALSPVTSYSLNRSHPIYGKIHFQEYLKNQKNKEEVFFTKIVKEYDNVRIIDPSPAYCKASCSSGFDVNLWYRDSNHVTNDGAFAAQEFFKVVFDASGL